MKNRTSLHSVYDYDLKPRGSLSFGISTHAKEMGWQQEMNLQVQICEGDDIVY